jgi:hypothetical protein
MTDSPRDESERAQPATDRVFADVASDALHWLAASIAACYRSMDPLIAQVIAAPGVLPVPREDP